MASETQAAHNQFDMFGFLSEAGGLSYAILIVLVAMSLACWFITLTPDLGPAKDQQGFCGSPQEVLDVGQPARRHRGARRP